MRTSDSIWQALQAARAANLSQRGARAPRAGMHGITRRRVLQAMGAASLSTLSTGSAVAAIRPNPRIAIIGGGIAGLTALHRLREAGIDAHCHEAKARLGGRMFTRRPQGSDTAFEMGAQLVNTDHHDMQSLLRTFGIPLLDRKRAPHRSMILKDGVAVPPQAACEALRPIAAQIAEDAARLDRDYTGVAHELDSLSIADYLDRHADRLTPWVRGLLETTGRTEYGAEPDQASALELVWNLPTVDGEDMEVLGGSNERYLVAGGTSALIDAMADRLADHITTGRRLLRADPIGGQVRLQFLDGAVELADMVIIAVPAPVIRQIAFGMPVPALWRQYFNEIELGTNEKLLAAMKGRPWAGPLGLGGDLWSVEQRTGWASGWDGSIDPSSPDGVWTWYLGGKDARDLAQTTADDVAQFFGAWTDRAITGMGEGQREVVRTAWHRDPTTLGAYTNYKPGQITRFSPLLWVESAHRRPARTPGFGPFIFAGEHLSDAWPGYMNGGAQTGRLAADAILDRIDIAKAA